jgi:hypothetical protein
VIAGPGESGVNATASASYVIKPEAAMPTALDNLREEWTDIARTLQRQINLIERGSLNVTLPEHQRAPMLKRMQDAVYEMAELQRAFSAQ